MEVEYKDMLHYQQCLLQSYHTILPEYNIQLHYCDSQSITGRLNELEKLLWITIAIIYIYTHIHTRRWLITPVRVLEIIFTSIV